LLLYKKMNQKICSC